MDIKKAVAGLLLAAFSIAAAAPITAPPAKSAPAKTPVAAQTPPAPADDAVKYANNVYLAYVRSSSSQKNDDAEIGLQTLAAVLVKRTTVAPVGVVALDIERSNINFFPFIYWPVTKDAPALSTMAREKVKNYLNGGGLILFDIPEQEDANLRTSPTLDRLLGDASMKRLMPMPKDHTLTQTFYLLSAMPGSNEGGSLRVEAPGSKGMENVSSVIVCNKNWGGAWAGTSVLLDSPEREMALRAGVNMVEYALTGNTKTDVLYKPAILERRQ